MRRSFVLARSSLSCGSAHHPTPASSAPTAAAPRGDASPQPADGGVVAVRTACPDPPGALATQTGAAPATLPSAPEDTSAPVRQTCQAAARASAAVLARATGRPRGPQGDPGPFGRCSPAGRGAWLLALEDYRGGLEHGCQDGPRVWGFEAHYRVVYVGPDGRQTPEPGDARAVSVHACTNTRVEAPFTHDFDGDGVAELLLTQTTATTQRTDVAGALVTVRAGAVGAYAPASDGLSRGLRVANVDADGRPDFVLPGPYLDDDMSDASEADEARGVSAVLHALADGGFSRDDAVARAWVARQCVDRASPAAVGTNLRALAFFVGCARFRGERGADIEAAIRAAQAQRSESERLGDSDFAAIRAMGAAAPPFTLTPCDR